MLNRNFLVIYDVCDDKRRRKVVKILEKYGYRIQYSAFECLFSDRSKKTAIKELEHITKEEDSIRIYKMPESVHIINQGDFSFDKPPEVVIL